MARVAQLGVWLGDEQVAVLRRTGVGSVSCEYLRDVVAGNPLGSPLLSCSLPLRRGRQSAWSFVTGLLPEGQHRSSMSRLAGVDTLDVLGMLDRFGRDVAGALTIASEASTPREQSAVPLTDDELLADVERLPARSLALHDDSELSLAGLEDKLLLVRRPGGWARPVQGYPSTHILKVDNRVHRGIVVSEHDALELARSAGLDAPSSELVKMGDADCIVVERFDRRVTKEGVERVHQEDACQAMGIDPARLPEGKGKYEAFGGPALHDVAGLLVAYALDVEAELCRLLQRVLFTVVVGDADAHGKNLALLHPEVEHIRLAPLYDTVPTALWPKLRGAAAMRINGRERLMDVTRQDLLDESRRWGLASTRAARLLDETCEGLREASTQVPIRGDRDLGGFVRGSLDRLSG